MAVYSWAVQTAVDQSVPTHCKSHTPQVGTGGKEAYRDWLPVASAVFLGPPALKEQGEGASSRDENPSNQTTQVVHLGGQILETFWERKKGSLFSAPSFISSHFL